MTEEGKKLDDEKQRWDLVPPLAMEDVVRVLTYGAKKYAPDNWRKVPDARRRYYAAAMRHLAAWWQGAETDMESGLPHLAHAACCLLFLRELENEADPLQYDLRKLAEEVFAPDDGAGPAEPVTEPKTGWVVRGANGYWIGPSLNSPHWTDRLPDARVFATAQIMDWTPSERCVRVVLDENGRPYDLADATKASPGT